MRKHDCGCQTDWDDANDHPVYLNTCGLHRRQVPDGWYLKVKPKRESVSA